MKTSETAEETILLVDDQPSNLQLLSQTLQGSGCRLLFARDGESALLIARKVRPNLILLDILMPGIDGFEVCRRLKTSADTQGIPVIFLSALDDTRDKVRGLQLGAVDYIAKPFQPEEVIARVNTHLTIHRLSSEVKRQRDELEKELEIVSQLQRNLLPEKLPELHGVKLAVYYETSRYTGGDYYDILVLPDNRLAILVADAEGHSAPATVMMAMTCALFRSCTECHGDPDRMIAFLNHHLCRVNKGSFVTAIYAVYDPASHVMRLARAGNPLPVLHRPSRGEAIEIDCEGVLLMGIEPYTDVPVTELTLAPGDHLLLYTDGVTDRSNEQRELYGTQRLLKRVGEVVSWDPTDLIEKIVEDLSRFAGAFPADDDQAMLAIVIE